MGAELAGWCELWRRFWYLVRVRRARIVCCPRCGDPCRIDRSWGVYAICDDCKYEKCLVFRGND